MPSLLLLCLTLLLLQATALPINITRLTNHLTTLATHNDLPPPSVQRIIYTPADVSSRAYLKSLFKQAGLKIHEDPLGNIFATWHPQKAPGILTGSHFDAIPNSGMYDGTLGILSALEAITSLNESGFIPKRSITILAFTSEEPTRFGLSCIGSRVLSGVLPPQDLSDLSDIHGTPFHAARATAGYTDDVRKVPLQKGTYTAFVELHSEQGPLLENSHTDIGAVTSIAAPAALSVKFTGPGGHAGTTLMQERKDPSLAAAELSLVVESAAKQFGTVDTVATSGYVSIIPNAVNSVPTEAKLGIDVRDIDEKRRDRVLNVIETAARVIAKKRGVGVEVVVNSRDPPAGCDDQVVQAVMSVAEEHGMKARKMVSRAYHDALFMAQFMPTGMIFVPCRGGISHRPDEFVSQRDMENGVRVLAGVLKQLAGEADARDGEPTVNDVGVVEESGEMVEEILDTVRKQDANVEDSLVDAEEEEEEEGRKWVESPEPAKSGKGESRKSGYGGEEAGSEGTEVTRDKKVSASKNGAKGVAKGKQDNRENDGGEMTTSASPKNSRERDAMSVSNPALEAATRKKIEEAGDPNVTCTCTASNNMKPSETRKEVKSDSEEIATSAKPKIRSSGGPEVTKPHEATTGELSDRKQEVRKSGNGRRKRSTERENGNVIKPDVPGNDRQTVVESGEKMTSKARGRRGRKSSASQSDNYMEEKDEV